MIYAQGGTNYRTQLVGHIYERQRGHLCMIYAQGGTNYRTQLVGHIYERQRGVTCA